MKLSGRNQLKATIKEIKEDGIMAKVVLDYKGERLVSVVTADSVADLELKVGDDVTALIKSTSVMLMK
ncbi:molybdopterin-binding protein [Hydrogenispora ethanolica]|jgi:molybdopterin-binding protein|uniref:Molybdopterin-binding protein n=1 Tax=Hydrogenispora ethanolica TaxID=1082276 RepID=A0A4R1SB96_HYDET|nr:TOBE domain-containing protein [Hydrogenispora ethanolica]TCL76534.1 molybdopterin-binding protein [Hydrogenispora ethanolica]